MLSKENKILLGLVGLIAIVGLVGYFLQKKESIPPAKEESMSEGSILDIEQDKALSEKNPQQPGNDEAMETGDGYSNYTPEKMEWAKEGKVILFFHASWCPICRSLDSDIREHLSLIPKNTHILKVDYDTANDLKLKYGVTSQHTFVQVDAAGDQISKWSNSENLTDVLARIQ